MSSRPQASEPPALEDDTHEDDRGHLRGPLQTDRDYLFVVLEADRPLAGGARYALDQTDEVVICRGRERRAIRERSAGIRRLVLSLPSRRLSGVHARIRRVNGDWLVADAGSTNGSYLNGERIESAVIRSEDLLELGRTFLMLASSPTPSDQPPLDLDSSELSSRPAAFATLRPDLSGRLAELERVATSLITPVLWGETGTGKEVLAAAVHTLSGRPGALVAVNCGALPAALVESQLFGHVRGAFSGALTDSSGFVRAAERGTLLLDEVQDLSPSGQAALLRVLQEREVVPIGSARPCKVDVRFIATAPAPLDEFVRAGKLRADLQSRLQGISHGLSPLRERRQDLGVLTAALLRKAGIATADAPSLSLDFALRLLRHRWPLNVRELEQLLLRGWALAQGGCLDVDFPVAAAGQRESGTRAQAELSLDELALRERIVAELGAARGNVAAAARSLGKAPMQLRRWLKRFAIDPDTFRG